jgi:hypothetical protein
LAPTKAAPTADSEEPNLAKLLTDSVLPSVAASKTLRVEAIRTEPDTLIEPPNRTKLRTEIELPRATESRTVSDEPNWTAP